MRDDTCPTPSRSAAGRSAPGRAAATGGVPIALPLLGRGRHRSARSGACFMEMASFLAGEPWSDHPACTHPLLARLARDVNDRTSDDARPRLGLLVPAVVGLHDDDPATDARLALLAARRALPVSPGERQHALAVALLTGEAVLARLEGRAEDDLGAATGAALEQVPEAAAWARRFTAAAQGRPGRPSGRRDAPGQDRRTRAYRRHGAPFAVTAATAGIAAAGGVDADALLHDLLADGVALVAAGAPPVVPTAPDRWSQACRLTGAGRR